jgi:ABC-type lipoprotein export system ATPase subunit
LDLASTERVARAIEAARTGGRVIIAITHDAVLAERIGDVRVFLERGRVVRVEERAEKPAAT